MKLLIQTEKNTKWVTLPHTIHEEYQIIDYQGELDLPAAFFCDSSVDDLNFLAMTILDFNDQELAKLNEYLNNHNETLEIQEVIEFTLKLGKFNL